MVFATGKDAEKLKKDYVTEDEDKDTVTISWKMAILGGIGAALCLVGASRVGEISGHIFSGYVLQKVRA